MIKEAAQKVNNLLEDSKIRLTTLVGCFVFFISCITGLVAFIYYEGTWRTNIQRDVQETQKVVNEVKAIVEKGTSDRFTYRQMETWILRFQELNESRDIKIPTLPSRSP